MRIEVKTANKPFKRTKNSGLFRSSTFYPTIFFPLLGRLYESEGFEYMKTFLAILVTAFCLISVSAKANDQILKHAYDSRQSDLQV